MTPEEREAKFTKKCILWLHEMKGEGDETPKATKPQPTHKLIFDEKERTYTPVPIPQYERGD